jgi:hypothetical protein
MSRSRLNILNPVHSRRSALIKIATAATSAAIAPLLADMPEAEHHVHEMLEQAAAPLATGPAYFSQADWETVSKLADLIIPRTDTPGAVDAGVPHWIDYHVAAEPELQEKFRQGLAYLTEQAHTMSVSSFAALTEQQQTAILQALSSDADTAKSGFFRTVKDLTIDGYYSSENGLVEELGFKGNTFRASFPGCTHPEHWPAAIAEERSK